ncbi:MAG: magnesium transporter, partial [Proteobacteria bacterium]|nr:magnesium transporter [Pseudomonadota bacterium]
MTGRGVEAPTPQPRHQGSGGAKLDLYGLTPELIGAIEQALDERNLEQVEALVVPLHAADMADLLEMVATHERRLIVEVLRPEIDPDILAELEETVRDEIVELLSTDELASAVAQLDTDDAMYLIEDLDEDERRELLAAVSSEDRAALEEGLAYPENSAGRLMQRDLVTVPQYWTIGQLIDYLRASDDLPDEFYDIFVIDPRHQPTGYVPLSRAMRSRRPVLVKDCMES